MSGLPQPQTAFPVMRRRSLNGWWDGCLNWLADARSHRVFCLVGGIWLINAFDLVLTILSHQQGLLVEQNPFARRMLAHGIPSLVLYKIGLVLIGSYPLLKFRAARIAEWGALVVLIAYAALAIRWSDCYDAYSVAFHSTVHHVQVSPVPVVR